MEPDAMEQVIEKYVLLNAVRHKGKASAGNVIGSIIHEVPAFKDQVKQYAPAVQATVKRINAMSPDAQQELAKEKYPDLLEAKPAEDRNLFAFLKIPEGTKVRTAFPPGPEKYPHIGHAKALILNHELAQAYKGTFYLRFEDTNPALVKKEYYDAMLDSFRWLGVTWDKLDYASDHMQTYYDHAQQLMEQGKAYLCTCSQDTIKENRRKGKACACRDRHADFQQIFSAAEGTAIIRLRIDLKHKNSTMRDPAILRIIDQPHARHGTKYRVWPAYDFQNAIMDGLQQITHRLRSKEFELRNELQRHIQQLLGYEQTQIYEFARFNLKGVESSGRIIREQIEQGKLLGWDDPSLTTLVALRRRGFLPEAIRSFVLSTGITKAESTLTWDDLIMHNKRLLDQEARRYFFIPNPQEITISNTPKHKVEVKYHPDDPTKGKRSFRIHDKFLLAEKDVQQIKDKEIVRLIDCLNFTRQGDSFVFHSWDYDAYKGKGKRIIQWLPVDQHIPVRILQPDHTIVEGVAEDSAAKIKEGTTIQFVRFAFCRLDEKKKDNLSFWYTHA